VQTDQTQAPHEVWAQRRPANTNLDGRRGHEAPRRSQSNDEEGQSKVVEEENRQKGKGKIAHNPDIRPTCGLIVSFHTFFYSRSFTAVRSFAGLHWPSVPNHEGAESQVGRDKKKTTTVAALARLLLLHSRVGHS